VSEPTIVQRVVAEFFQLTVEELRAPRQGNHKGEQQTRHATARHIGRYLERERGTVFKVIGEQYQCDHSSALASVAHMKERLAARDARYIGPVELLRGRVLSLFREVEPITNDLVEKISCPTCGAPIVAELYRKIDALQYQIDKLGERDARAGETAERSNGYYAKVHNSIQR